MGLSLILVWKWRIQEKRKVTTLYLYRKNKEQETDASKTHKEGFRAREAAKAKPRVKRRGDSRQEAKELL